MSNNHNCKELDKILDKIIELGFRVEKNGVLLKIYPPDKTKPFYSCHLGERAYHPIRRYIKNTCGIKI